MNELRRKCFKCGCSPRDTDIKLFRFPRPGSSNILKCESWAKFCLPDKEWFSTSFQWKLYKEHRMLCERHFASSSFVNYAEKKLDRLAVPIESNQVDDFLHTGGTRTDATGNDEHIDGNDTQHQTTAGTPTEGTSSNIYEDETQTQDQTRTVAVAGDVKSRKRKYMNLQLMKGQKAPKKITKIDVPQVDLNYMKLLLQEREEVHNDDDILSDLGLDELQDDPRSPSPEQDIEVNMCRICVQSFSKLISLESYGLRTAYEQVTGVSVEHDDGLPRELCVECATLLDKYHRFRDKAIKGDLLLRQIYNKDGVTEKFPLEELEEAITNLASKIDFCAEVTCIDIDPEDTESQVPERKDETSDKKVIETDLDMSVDEPAEEEWLTLSDDNEDIRSPTATSVHDDDEVSIKEEELDLDGDHTDPLDSELVNIQPEILNTSVGEQPKILNTSEGEQPEILNTSVGEQPEIQSKSVVELPEKQHAQQPQTQLLSLLKQLKSRNSLVKQPETQKISLLKDPGSQQISLVKHPKTQQISLLKQLKTRNSLVKQPETQKISLLRATRSQQISLVKQPETQHICLVKDSETQHILVDLVKDTKTQQESLIKAYYCIQKLDVRDQKLKHIRKRKLADYRISKYTCELCYEGFNTAYALKSHEVHDVDQGDVTCPICQSRFREPRDLKEHSEDVHQSIFNCRICKRDILTRTLALRHIKEHLPCIRLNK